MTEPEPRFPGTIVVIAAVTGFIVGFAVGPLFFLLVSAP